MASQSRTEANRRNALRSTGPRTEAGKAVSRLNALKHGITAETVLLESEDPAAFAALRDSFFDHLDPQDPVEALLAERVVLAAWRLERVRGMETGLFQHFVREAEDALKHRPDLTARDHNARAFLRDSNNANSLTLLARYETRLERSFYTALREFRRLRSTPPSGGGPSSPAAVRPISPSAVNEMPLPASADPGPSPAPAEIAKRTQPPASAGSFRRLENTPKLPSIAAGTPRPFVYDSD